MIDDTKSLFGIIPENENSAAVAGDLAELTRAAIRAGIPHDDIAAALLTAAHWHALRTARRDDLIAAFAATTTSLQRATGQPEN